MAPTTRPVAQRMAAIQPFHVMEILARAKALEAQGHDVVHMEVGEPDFATAAPIVAAGQAALTAGETHYTQAVGIPALREAIARYYGTRYGLELDPARVVVTPGASGALQLVLSCILNPGDRVLMPDPCYPCNRHFVRLVEGEARCLPVGPETRFQLTPTLVADAWDDRTAAVMLASPANPTGTMVPENDLRDIAAVTAQRGGWFIVDEIYHGLVYGDHPKTALQLDPRAIVINSFSKYFGMTGWRLGWIVAPADLVPVLDKLAQNLFLCAPTPAQHAAVAAFTDESLAICEARRQEFQARRDLMVPALREMGFGLPVVPQGAFYLYADVSGLTADSQAFARRLLEEAHVAITPGLDFGSAAAAQYVRFAYTTHADRLREGLRRLRMFLGRA